MKDYMETFKGEKKPKAITVLALNATLKTSPQPTNTQELILLVIDEMKKSATIKSETIRLADHAILSGIGMNLGAGDAWPVIQKKIIEADIVLFGTPVWWGNHSSHMQKMLERLDALHTVYLKTEKTPLYDKPAGFVVTGHEDGAMRIIGHLMIVLSYMGFRFPPEAGAYWTGEVGVPGNKDAEKRRDNAGVKRMARLLARNLIGRHRARYGK